MVGWQALSPELWQRFRNTATVGQEQAMRKVLTQLFVDNRDSNISRKRVPYRNQHVAQYKAAMRSGNLSAAAWNLTHLGVDPDQLNAAAILIVN